MINRITVWIGVVMLLSCSLCGQEAEISDLLDRYVGLDGPLPRNESVVLELLESPALLKSELLDRIEVERPLPELYFYGVLANRSLDGDLKYQVWKAAATASLEPDAQAWSSAESVIAFLPLARAEDVELLEELSEQKFPAAPGLPRSLKQRIAKFEARVRPENSQVSQIHKHSVEVEESGVQTFPKWALAVFAVAVLGILFLLIRGFLRNQAS